MNGERSCRSCAIARAVDRVRGSTSDRRAADARSNLDGLLREPDVIDEAIREHREMWVLLYRSSAGFDVDDP
jgi:hypothetical protein